jgi:hypothetical protein
MMRGRWTLSAALVGALGLTLAIAGGPARDAGGRGPDAGERPVTTRTAGEQLAGQVAAWRGHWGDQPYLDEAQTRALVAQRRAATDALVAAIGSGGPEAALAAAAAYREAPGSRERLALLQGLGANPSSEALDALEAIYGEEPRFRLREEALRSLGRSEAPGHEHVLTELLGEASDERLQQIAAQALYGEAGAVGALTDAARSDLCVNARLEALHSLAGVGGDEATQALAEIADSEGLEPRVRQFARRELERRSM